jgi:hypothetical protein
MITCHVRYEIDPNEIEAFERFARRWMELVVPSLAEYERYRERFGVDQEFVEADRIRDESGCVRRYERSFLRPLLPSSP